MPNRIKVLFHDKFQGPNNSHLTSDVEIGFNFTGWLRDLHQSVNFFAGSAHIPAAFFRLVASG